MGLSYGEQPEPWMNTEAHNRHSSRKGAKKERHKKLRRVPITKDVRSLLKKWSGWEW